MTSSALPGAAIIGAGLMGRWHADAVERIGGRVTVIVDTNETALTALAGRYPRARRLTGMDPVAIARDAGVAHVCTPLATHQHIVTGLLGGGVHTLVEKPLASNAPETERLLRDAESRGLLVCPVHQFVFQSGFRELREWLPALGTIRRVTFSTCSAGAIGRDSGGLDEFVAEVLPHPLSLARALLGIPLADVAWHVMSPEPGELMASATVGGVAFELAISAHGRPTANTFGVIADGGSVEIDLFHGFAVRHGPGVSRSAKIAQPFLFAGQGLAAASKNLVRRALRREQAYPGLRELVRAFYTSVARRGSAPFSIQETIDVARARDRIMSGVARRAG